MKRTKKFLMSALLMMPLLFAVSVPVAAETADNNTATTTAATTASTDVEELRTRVKKTAEERIAADKQKLNERVTSAEQNRIKNKCQAAQNLIKAYSKKVDNYEASRQQVYTKITDRLTSLANKLEVAGKTEDAETVKSKTAELQSKINEVYAAIDDYQQALVDLSELDCTSDPTAFKAVLESARNNRAIIQEKTKAVRSYYVESLTSALAQIKAKLNEAAQSTEDSEGASQ